MVSAHFELAWLAELRRVLVPGGFAYLTIHSEHTWRIYDPRVADLEVAYGEQGVHSGLQSLS